MNYRYKARDKYGKFVSGIIAGEDRDAVAKHLHGMGYVPVGIEETKQLDIGLTKRFDIFNRITAAEVNLFTRQLLTLQRAGVPLLTGLDVMVKQTSNRRFKEVIGSAASEVETGISFSDALAKHKDVFGELYVNMVKAGEASGLLDDMLSRLAELGERDIETEQKIKAATRYPLITLGALFCAFLIVVTFVIPRFAAVFSQFGTNLPLPTRMLLALSYIMQHYWLIFILAIGSAVYAFFRYIHSQKGRMRWDGLKLHVPVFGPLVTMLVMSRFSRTMALLIKSGLPILQVLEMTARTVNNAVVGRAIENVATSVKEGKGISEPLKVSGLFPPIVTQMVAIGEETGKIDDLLLRVSEYYDQQSDYVIRNLTIAIEPVFVLILGSMVLTMALSIFLPMWNLITLFKS